VSERTTPDSAWDTSKEEPEKWAQKRRLADAMRRVIERLLLSDAPEAELRLAAERLEAYGEALAGHPRLRFVHGYAESANAGDVSAFFDRSPMIGLANPLAPPITLAKTGERTAEGRVVFSSAYEGPPGHVHGGFVAAAFDEVLGFVQSLSGRPGMTGTLVVRYRRPTPLHTELRFEAEYLRAERRKLFTEARVYAGDVLCAEAEGLFVSIERARFEELEAQRAAGEAARAKDADGSERA
jgi:acyl-coenzyme A thioesterase PaaI-like protein